MSDYGLDENMLQEQPQETIETPVEQPSEKPSFEYSANGKTVKEDIDTILKRASQGYNYAQHMTSLKQQQSDLESRMKQAQELESQWKPYQEYAQQNPEWANHWKQAYDNRFNSFSGQQNEQPSYQSQDNSEVSALKSQIAELRSLYDKDKETRMVEQQDIELNNQINEVKSLYPDVDFSYSDPETGKSLEYAVLEHGSLHGITSFKAAFRDFYHDQLMQNAVSRAKEDTAKELQNRQKKGFMSTSDTPQLMTTQSRDSRKNMSYEQIIQEAMRGQS
jgi:hypothetical protein